MPDITVIKEAEMLCNFHHDAGLFTYILSSRMVNEH